MASLNMQMTSRDKNYFCLSEMIVIVLQISINLRLRDYQQSMAEEQLKEFIQIELQSRRHVSETGLDKDNLEGSSRKANDYCETIVDVYQQQNLNGSFDQQSQQNKRDENYQVNERIEDSRSQPQSPLKNISNQKTVSWYNRQIQSEQYQYTKQKNQKFQEEAVKQKCQQIINAKPSEQEKGRAENSQQVTNIIQPIQFISENTNRNLKQTTEELINQIGKSQKINQIVEKLSGIIQKAQTEAKLSNNPQIFKQEEGNSKNEQEEVQPPKDPENFIYGPYHQSPGRVAPGNVKSFNKL